MCRVFVQEMQVSRVGLSVLSFAFFLPLGVFSMGVPVNLYEHARCARGVSVSECVCGIPFV